MEEEEEMHLVQIPDEDEDEDVEMLLAQCREKFKSTDYILEPGVFKTLSQYFQAGGNPGPVVELLAENYTGFPQICNVMGEWLIELGMEGRKVEKIFEEHLSALIAKNFRPKKADSIFDQPESESGIEWLPELISHQPWRSLIYSLTEDYPECLMLNFAVKLISDAGYQHEISSVTTAAQQLDIFSRVLTAAVDGILGEKPDTCAYRKALGELVRVSCYSEYTFLFTQALLFLLSHQEQNTKGGAATAVKHIFHALCRIAEGDAVGITVPEALGSGQDTTELIMALFNSDAFSSAYNPALIQAMHSMLSKKSLNPADMTLLHNWYTQSEPPPLALIRIPAFVELLIESLFSPRAAKVHEDHRHKYLYLLAYATTVVEEVKKGVRKHSNRDEIEETEKTMDSVSQLCQGRGDTASHVLARLSSIYQDLKIPVVAGGILHWIKCTVTEADYFQLHPEPVPIHLALLDEIASQHPLLQSKIFTLLTELFEKISLNASGTMGEVLMERHKAFIDRFVHLLWEGYALPVTEFIGQQRKSGAVDISLVRYFVVETLDVIGPPYAAEFLAVFLPLVEDEEIVDEAILDKHPQIKEFLLHCKSQE